MIRDFIGFGPDLLEQDLKEFRLAARTLSGISQNLNQITARINSGKYQADPLKQDKINILLCDVDNLRKEIRFYIDRTVSRSSEVISNE